MARAKKIKIDNPDGKLSGKIADIYFDYKQLQSLNLVTRGITHNYNNIFSGVLGCLETPVSADNLEQTKNLKELISRAISETEILFDFARYSKKINCVQSVSGIVESAANALRAVSPKYKVMITCNNPFVKVEGWFSDLILMLFYLGENSIEAMPGGGNVFFDVVEQYDENDALWIKIVVSDDGPGVDPALRDTLFSPFVTTKEQDSHHGLGLYVARQIAESHGGYLSFVPQTSGGSIFNLQLPAYLPQEPVSVMETVEKKSDSTPQNNSRHVFFIIEDDRILLDYLVDGLQRKGHIVFSASSCREALEEFKNTCNIITLFVVDLGLTDIDGIECMKMLREINAAPGVIFMSGDAIESRSETLNQAAFLAKPFTIKQLEEMAEHVSPSR